MFSRATAPHHREGGNAQPSPRRGEGRKARASWAAMRSEPSFKPSAIRARCAALGSTRCVSRYGIPHNAPQPLRLIPSLCCRALALKAIFFGLLFFWASKRKVTRASADDRNARCVSGPITTASATEGRIKAQPRPGPKRPGLARNVAQKKRPERGHPPTTPRLLPFRPPEVTPGQLAEG